jgi:gamma-glutamyltranspeptidase/glutathione hydrolase
MRDVLVEGGRAADAAVAGYFALSVTLPSSAGLSAGGACVVFDPSSERYERLSFPALPSSDQSPAIALPTASRAMFALHARYGRLRFESLITEAERLARFGEPVSARLAADLRWAGPSVLADPTLAKVLGRPDRTPRRLGDPLTQIDLGATFGRLRSAGIGDLYVGPTARAFVEAVRDAGFAIDSERLRGALPRWSEAETFPHDNHAWSVVGSEPISEQRAATALADLLDAGGWPGDSGVEGAGRITRALSNGAASDGAPIRPDVPGATSFMVVDRAGQTVACAIGMGRPFGLGRTASGMGIVLRPAAESGAASALAVVAGNKNTWQVHLSAVAGGGRSAISALLLPVLAHFEGGASVLAAVDAARVYRDPEGQTLYVEPEWTDADRSVLARSGLTVREVPALGHTALFRCIEGIPREAQSCDLAGDRRGGGLVLFERE